VHIKFEIITKELLVDIVGSLSRKLHNHQWVQLSGNRHRFGKHICITYTSLKGELATECSVCFVRWVIFVRKNIVVSAGHLRHAVTSALKVASTA